MRALLRKWLGVTDMPTLPDVSKFIVLMGDEVKNQVESAMEEAFRPEDDPQVRRLRFYNDVKRKHINGLVDKAVKKMMSEHAIKLVTERLDAIVEPESFIDKVVVRIKTKQLS